MHVDFSGASPDALAHALARGVPHLVPPLLAVRDHGCRFMIAAQSKLRFTIPQDRPAIVVIGDDLSAALGPPGFHARSLRRYFARCRHVVIVACEPLPIAYGAAADRAVRDREDVAIIETRPEKEADWYAYVREVRPDVKVLLATVMPEGSA